MNAAILYRISFFIYLAAILIVGSWGYKKIKSASDYFVANRSLGNILSTATFAGAYTSAATILGIVSLNYGLGIQYFTGLNIGIPLGAFLMVMLFIRPLRNFAGYTLSDVFVERYGQNVGALSGVIIGISYILLLVPQLIGGSAVMSMLLEIPWHISVITMGAVLIIYVVLGGVYAVAVTDFIQYFILFAVVVISGIYVLIKMGGITNIMTSAYAIAPQNFKPLGGWIKDPLYLIGLALAWSLGTAAQPYIVMRAYSAKNAVTAEKMVRNFSILQVINIFFLFFVGFACISLIKVKLPSSDMAMPYLLKNVFPTGLGILMLAGILGAILSTTDTILITIGATLSNNVFKRFLPKMTDKALVWTSRIIIIVSGILSVLFAMRPPGLISVVMGEIIGFVGCSFFIPLLCAFYWGRATKQGAFASMLGGSVAYALWKAFVPPSLSSIHPILIGIAVGLIMMLVVSYATEKPSKEIMEKFRGYTK